MYAAGHPPLPAFEVSPRFLAAMPPHWYKPDEVPLFREQPAQRQHYGFEPTELTETKLVVIGGVSAFRESMRLLAAGGRISTSARTSRFGEAWPNFAQLNCCSLPPELMSPGYLSWPAEGSAEVGTASMAWRSEE